MQPFFLTAAALVALVERPPRRERSARCSGVIMPDGLAEISLAIPQNLRKRGMSEP
jgi:hypothetical protein